MAKLQVQLSDRDAESLKELAAQLNYVTDRGAMKGQPSVTGLIRALARRELFSPTGNDSEPPQSLTRDAFMDWWGRIYPEPTQETGAWNAWNKRRWAEWRRYSESENMRDAASFGAWLGNIEGLGEFFLLLGKAHQLRGARRSWRQRATRHESAAS